MIWASDTFGTWAVGLYAIITPGLCALLGYIDPDGSLTNLLLTLSPELVLIFHLDFTTLRKMLGLVCFCWGTAWLVFASNHAAFAAPAHEKSGLSGCGLMVETVQ